MSDGVIVDSNWVANRLGRAVRRKMKKDKCEKQGGQFKGGKCIFRK